jgi:hypothetical protein
MRWPGSTLHILIARTGQPSFKSYETIAKASVSTMALLYYYDVL